jgi:VCBS repeat-containing protein
MGLTRRLQRLIKRKEVSIAAKRRRKALMEPLEPRLLLDAAPVAVDDSYAGFEDTELRVVAEDGLMKVDTRDAEQLLGAGSYLYADFGEGVGVYRYYASKWTRINSNDAEGMAKVGSTLYLDCGSSGVYRLGKKIDERNAEQLYGVGTNLYADFGDGVGLYQYDGNAWSVVSGMNPEGMAGVGTTLYVDGGSSGVYQYANGALTQVDTRDAEQLLGAGSYLYADFGEGVGVYRYYAGKWTRTNPNDAEGMAKVGSTLYLDCGSSGVYRLGKKIDERDAEQLYGVGTNLYADFGDGVGLYQYDGNAWSVVSGMNPEGMAGVGTALYVDGGSSGVYQHVRGVLANDTDIDGDPLTATLVSDPAHGTVQFQTDGFFIYMPAGNFNGTDRFSYRVSDGALHSDEAVVTLTVKSVNDPPVVTPQSLTVNEDQGLTGFVSGTDPDGDALTYSKVGTVPLHGTVSVASDGAFTYTPNPDFFGTDSFRFRAYDGKGYSTNGTVSISVLRVNDAPSFMAGTDQTVAEDSGAQSVPGWAAAMSAGPANEASQVLSFVVTNDNAGLFTEQPAISPGGILTYTPDVNANGVANVTVVLRDNGGTARAGVNTSAPQSFLITLTPVNDEPTASGLPDLTVDEDASDRVIDLSQFFADVDLVYGDLLTYTVTASGSIPIPALLDQISEASYTDIHQDLLYTHSGDNRGLNGPQHDLARNNIFNYFENLGLDTSLDPFTYNGGTYYNVVGVQPGTTRPDDIYILGAHYDSVNNPGADDNASGVAAVMEAARVLSAYEFDATLTFIAFDREEQGLKGSTAYANAHAADHILGMISFDMIAYNPAGANHDMLRIYDGDGADDPIMQEMLDAFNVLGYGRGITAVDSGSISASDHAPFDQKGFEAVLLIEYGVWSNPYYHKTTDAVETPGYIDYTFATSVTAGGVGYIVSQSGLTPGNLPFAVSISGDQLILDYLDNRFGAAEVTIRATDTSDLYVEDTFKVTVSPVENLKAAEAPVEGTDAGPVLSSAQLGAIVDEAINRWAETKVVDEDALNRLESVTFQIVDLSGLTLGQASADTIVIDVDAAGWGWFVDATPGDDLEFGLRLNELELMATATSPAFGRMDLLTVVMHEMGHVLGYQDLDSSSDTLMGGTLDAGTRRLSESTAESPKLVQMDKAPGAEVATLLYGAKQGKSSWLEDFLVNGSDCSPFDPMDKIEISIPGNNGEGTKKRLH